MYRVGFRDALGQTCRYSPVSKPFERAFGRQGPTIQRFLPCWAQIKFAHWFCTNYDFFHCKHISNAITGSPRSSTPPPQRPCVKSASQTETWRKLFFFCGDCTITHKMPKSNRKQKRFKSRLRECHGGMCTRAACTGMQKGIFFLTVPQP